MADDELGGAKEFAPRLARLMAKELAATFNAERSELAQRLAEDEALIRYCRLPQAEIVRLRALPYTKKQRGRRPRRCGVDAGRDVLVGRGW